MIIGVDKEGNVISVGNPRDDKAYSIKVIKDRYINIISNNYRYDNGKLLNLGLKKSMTMTQEDVIKEELAELDKTINRATEDLYELTGTVPYKSTGDAIERKKELRQQLKNINEEKTEETIDTLEQETDVSEETSE